MWIQGIYCVVFVQGRYCWCCQEKAIDFLCQRKHQTRETQTAMMSQSDQTRLPYLARCEHLESARSAVAIVASGGSMALASVVETAGNGRRQKADWTGGSFERCFVTFVWWTMTVIEVAGIWRMNPWQKKLTQLRVMDSEYPRSDESYLGMYRGMPNCLPIATISGDAVSIRNGHYLMGQVLRRLFKQE